MKAIKPSLAWPPSVPSSAAAQLLELSFSVLSMLAPFFVTFFPSLQPATKTQDLHAFAGVAPSTDALLPSLDQLAAPPLLPEPEQLGPTGFSAVADAPWTCAQQRATGLLMPRYPCGGSALEQAAHLFRSPAFYLVVRPILLGDWIWVVWVLSHALVAAANAALLGARAAAAMGPGLPAPALPGSPAAACRSDPRVCTGSGESSLQNDTASDGRTSHDEPHCPSDAFVAAICLNSAHCNEAGDHPSEHSQPCTAAAQGATTAAPPRHEASRASTAPRLLRAWGCLREPLLLVASPCKCGFASLLYLCGWLAARGMGVDERRRRWVLLSAHNNGLAAARHPHLVALLSLVSVVCQPVRPSLLVRTCLASMASCLCLGLASAALGLPPWDSAAGRDDQTPPLRGLALSLTVIRAHLPAYAFAYLTAPLYLCIRSYLLHVYGGWAGVRQAITRLSHGCNTRDVPAQSVMACSGTSAGTEGRAQRGMRTWRCASGGVGSGPGSVLGMAAAELGGKLTGSVASGLTGGVGGGTLRQLSPAPSTAIPRVDTPEAAMPRHHGRCGSDSSNGSGSQTATRASAMLPFGLPLPVPDLAPATAGAYVARSASATAAAASSASPRMLRPAHSRHARALRCNARPGAAHAAASAAAAAAAALLGPARGPIAAHGPGVAPTAGGPVAASVGGGSLSLPSSLYRSRLPNSTLVMSRKFRIPPGMPYAAASGALRSMAYRCVQEAVAAKRAAAAAAGEVPGALLPRAGDDLSVDCLTLPGCVQLVLVIEGKDEARPRSGKDGVRCSSSSAAGARVSRGRLPSWLQPWALWAAVTRAAEGLGLRPLTAPRVQRVASGTGGGRGDEQYGLQRAAEEEVEEEEASGEGEEMEAKCAPVEVGRPRTPALVYAEPPVLCTAALACPLDSHEDPYGSDSQSGYVSCSAGSGCGASSGGQQQSIEQEGVRPGLVVDMFVPPGLLQGPCDQELEHEELTGAGADGSRPPGRRSLGGEDGWRLVVMATAATHGDAATPPPHVLLYPAAAPAPAPDPPPASYLHSRTVKGGCTTPPRRPSLSSPAASAAACTPPPAGLPLRLRLTPDALRHLGVLPDTVVPPTRHVGPQPLGSSPTQSPNPTPIPDPTPTPTPTPFALAASCASTSPSAPNLSSTAPSYLHPLHLGAREPQCGGSVRSALLQLHLLAVPRGAQLPPPSALSRSTPGRCVQQRNCSSDDSGFTTSRAFSTLEAAGSGAGAQGAAAGGDEVWGGSAMPEAAAASPCASLEGSHAHALPQAVWLGSAPLLLAPPGPAEELAGLWERAKEEVQQQQQQQQQQEQLERLEGASERYCPSSGSAMQHHMRPLLRDLAAVTRGQGQGAWTRAGAYGDGAAGSQDGAHLRAFLQFQGMTRCVEWLDGAGADGACWTGSWAAAADPLDSPLETSHSSSSSSSSSRTSFSGYSVASGDSAAA